MAQDGEEQADDGAAAMPAPPSDAGDGFLPPFAPVAPTGPEATEDAADGDDGPAAAGWADDTTVNTHANSRRAKGWRITPSETVTRRGAILL